MDERRGELGLAWHEVATRAGTSTETLYRIAKGRGSRPMRTPTRKGIERALEWVDGSIDAILASGPPTPADEPAEPEKPEPSMDDAIAMIEAMDRQLQTLKDTLTSRREHERRIG